MTMTKYGRTVRAADAEGKRVFNSRTSEIFTVLWVGTEKSRSTVYLFNESTGEVIHWTRSATYRMELA